MRDGRDVGRRGDYRRKRRKKKLFPWQGRVRGAVRALGRGPSMGPTAKFAGMSRARPRAARPQPTGRACEDGPAQARALSSGAQGPTKKKEKGRTKKGVLIEPVKTLTGRFKGQTMSDLES